MNFNLTEKRRRKMRTKIFIMVLAGILMIGGNLYAGDLVVNGGIQAGNVALTCSSSLNGVIRYTGTAYEYCNGTIWQPFGAVFTAAYESAPQPFAYLTHIVVSHGLGGIPKMYTVNLRCIASEHSFDVGDEIDITSVDHAQAVSLMETIVNATSITLITPTLMYIKDKVINLAFIPNASNWAIVIRAYR